MKICIKETALAWRAPSGEVFHFGVYEIPRDMSEDTAKAALESGVAEQVVEAPEAPKPVKK